MKVRILNDIGQKTTNVDVCLLQLMASLAKQLRLENLLESSRELNERIEQQLEEETIPESSEAKRHVAVFLDGSQISLQALQWALQHVLTLPTDVLYLVNIIPHEEFQEDSDRILRQGYEKARLSRVIIHKVSLSADEASSVGKAILEFVNEKNIDVAVMGDCGMGSMKSLLMGSLGLGSVSEFCARNLKCPVLVVKNGEAVSK